MHAELDAFEPGSWEELEAIVGVLGTVEVRLFHHHHANPWAKAAAEVIEALCACLTNSKIITATELSKNHWASRDQVLRRVARKLRHEAGMKRSRYGRGRLPADMLAMAEGVLKRTEGRARGERAYALAFTINMAIQSNPDEEGEFSSLGRGDARVAKLVAPIGEILRRKEVGSAKRTAGGSDAEQIVIACAKAAGVERPSAFLDTHRKQKQRRVRTT